MPGYGCPTCGRDDFAREVDMKAHHTKVHGESLVDREHQLKCPDCEEYFASEAGMKVHHASAHGESIAKTRNIPKSTRKEVLQRDDSQCQRCNGKVGGRGADYELHHILPVAAGGPDHPDNLLTLCTDCHREVHRELQSINDDHPDILDDLRTAISEEQSQGGSGYLSVAPWIKSGTNILPSIRERNKND